MSYQLAFRTATVILGPMSVSSINDHNKNARYIALWLFVCAATVFCMVVVGAITRLTDSGLSMVEWRPIMGAFPPMSVAECDRVFSLYKSSPEFQKEHFWMTKDDFKFIFFWEWFHRVLGRLIGILYFMPLVWFWVRNKIPTGYKPKLILLFVLGGCQGLMGWYMVQSGLVDVPAVSHYRLAAHLSLAFLIFVGLLWTGLSLLNWPRDINQYCSKLHIHSVVAVLVLSITIVWGAFTAGLDAGLIYNDSFPKMGEHWIPEDFYIYDTVWMNAINTHSGVQMIHRWLAILTVCILLSLWLHGYIKGIKHPALNGLACMTVLQFALGIATLMSHVSLPIATLHQAGALIMLAFLTLCLKMFSSRPVHSSPASETSDI